MDSLAQPISEVLVELSPTTTTMVVYKSTTHRSNTAPYLLATILVDYVAKTV